MSFLNQQVQSALQALRKSATKGKTKKSILENIDNVSSSTVLLNSSAPSVHAFNKLVSVFRAPFVPLYSNYTEPSLNVASAILKMVLSNGIMPCIMEDNNRDVERQIGWERVVHSLLSGVIDFLETNNSEKSKILVARAFYAPICEFFFFKDESVKAEIGASLRCVAYMLLSDSASLQHDNQSKLRDERVLGGIALGLTISKTRDFVVLETLLNLFAILLPSASSSKENLRNVYIRDVFTDKASTITNLLDSMSNCDWDTTATKVVDILAASDIKFPQPFDVDEVVVCDSKYPQPEMSDRLYIDRASFFVNVQQQDGMYEDLQVMYNNVRDIKFASPGPKTTPITVTLDKAPRIGEQDLSAGNKPLNLFVEIRNNDVPRFKEALRNRNLGTIIAGRKVQRVSMADAVEFDEDLLRRQETTPSPAQKAKDLEDFYKSDPVQAISSKDIPKTPKRNNIRKAASKVIREPEGRDGSKGRGDSGMPSIKPNLNASIFGGTDEELSEVEEAEASSAIKVNAKPTEARQERCAAATISEPAEVIVLSDDESVVDVKATSRGAKGIKKRPVKRIESDEKVTGEPMSGPPLGSTKDKLYVGPEFAKDANSFSRPEVKSVPRKKKQETVVADDHISARRPRRAAADTASAKLAAIVIENEDTTHAGKGFQEDLAGPVAKDVSKLVDAPTMEKTFSDHANDTRVPPFVESVATPSSPTSKISRMKPKQPHARTKPTKLKAQKRTIEQASSTGDELPHQKKPRVNANNDNDAEDHGDSSEVDDDSRSKVPRPAQKYGHRGRKAKTVPGLQKGTVDWDQVPKETPVSVKTGQRQEPSAPLAPVKVNKRAEKITRKENLVKKTDASDQKAVLKPETRSRPRPPLQEVVQSSNEAAEEPEHIDGPEYALQKETIVSRKDTTRHQAAIKPIDEKAKMNALPSLEDILLKGAAVTTEPEQEKATQAEEESVIHIDDNAETNLQTEPADEFTFASITDLDEEITDHENSRSEHPDNRRAQRHDEPQTPSSKKGMDSSVVSALVNRKSRKPFNLDVEMFDLTDEDIKEVLQSLRAKRTKKSGEGGEAIHSKQSTRRITAADTERDSSVEEHEVPVVQELPARPRVKFDETLRFKSASLESSRVEDLTEHRTTGSGRKKHRVIDGEPTSRGTTESTVRKHQEIQTRKEPGMEEIINVLDSIQNVVVSNIANKSRAVRRDIRMARDHLIHEAASDLHDMREESITHFNNLLALENEYANVNRKLNTGFEVVANVNSDICKFVRQTINAHDRGTLSKTMPQSLFISNLPQSFLKFT